MSRIILANMIIANTFDTHLYAALKDFVSVKTPWKRRLWKVGSLLCLKELLEASESLSSSGAGSDNFDFLRCECIQNAMRDPGVGPTSQRSVLKRTLSGTLNANGVDYLKVAQLIQDVEANYLDRWMTEPTKEKHYTPTFVASAIASHLLDGGYSMTFLREWLNSISSASTPFDANAIIADAHKLATTAAATFKVFVQLDKAPGSSQLMPAEWLDSVKASQWLRSKGFRTTRLAGALLLDVRARDVYSAIEKVVDITDTLTTRSMLGFAKSVVIHPELRIEGYAQTFPLQRQLRGVQIWSLEKEFRVYAQTPDPRTDNALELIASIDSGPPPVAVAGAWAATESLLNSPGDTSKGIAADRMASLIACSYPRAELTALSFAHSTNVADTLSTSLKNASSNLERCEILLQTLAANQAISTPRESDSIALDRIKAVIADPKTELNKIKRIAASSLRRLYRQRNLILHGGKTDTVCLDAALRCAAPLIGAGIDRIVHAWFVDIRHPLELLARAELSLELLGTANARPLTRLL